MIPIITPPFRPSLLMEELHTHRRQSACASLSICAYRQTTCQSLLFDKWRWSVLTVVHTKWGRVCRQAIKWRVIVIINNQIKKRDIYTYKSMEGKTRTGQKCCRKMAAQYRLSCGPLFWTETKRGVKGRVTSLNGWTWSKRWSQD